MMKRMHLIAGGGFLALALILGGYFFFASERTQYDSAVTADPMVFEGVLPCADCDGIDTKITFYPDGTYLLMEVFAGKDEELESSGTWIPRIKQEGTYYDLHAESGDLIRYFIRTDSETLRALDENGEDWKSDKNTTLKRVRS